MGTATAIGTISTEGLTDAEVLAALYNNARAQGLGWLHFTDDVMTVEQAQTELDLMKDYAYEPGNWREPKDSGVYFDYLHGRVMKVTIGHGEIDPTLYDRDNGTGAAARVIADLRASKTS